MGRVKTARPAAALLLSIALLLAGGCSSDLLDWAKNTAGKLGTVGTYSNGSKTIACYWKGATKIDLPGDSGDFNPGHSCQCNSAVMVNDTLYILQGNRWDGSKMVGCYWTVTGGNAAVADLPGGAGWTSSYNMGTYATQETLSQGLFYASGYWSDGINNTPCYWKIEGTSVTRTDLSPPVATSHSSVAGHVWLEDNIVYSSGWYWNGTSSVPCYWVNSAAPTPLPVPNVQVFDWDCQLYGFWKVGSTLYITGSYNINHNNPSVACFWTVTGSSISRTDLGDGSHDSAAWWSDLSTGTPYTDGRRSDGTKWIPCYWVGTQRYDLPGDSMDLTPGRNADTGGFIHAGDVLYVSGDYYDGSKQVACYWTIQGSTITRTDRTGAGYDTGDGGFFLY